MKVVAIIWISAIPSLISASPSTSWRFSSMAKKAKKDSKPSEDEIGFETALEDLERIVQELEGGKGTLDNSLDEYAQAIKLLKVCHQRLETAQRKVEILSGADGDGNPITTPMDEEEISLEEKREQRGKRRSATNARRASSDTGSELF